MRKKYVLSKGNQKMKQYAITAYVRIKARYKQVMDFKENKIISSTSNVYTALKILHTLSASYTFYKLVAWQKQFATKSTNDEE